MEYHPHRVMDYADRQQYKHDSRMRNLQQCLPYEMTSLEKKMIRSLMYNFRKGCLHITRFYTEMAAVIFRRPTWGAPGCIYFCKMNRDEILLIKSILDDNSGQTYMDAYDEEISVSRYTRRLPFFRNLITDQSVVLVNAIQMWNTENVMDFFSKLNFPLVGIVGRGIDGQQLFSMFTDKDAERLFTYPPPLGLGLNKLQFKGRLTVEINKNGL
jgi:hypothetical protein